MRIVLTKVKAVLFAILFAGSAAWFCPGQALVAEAKGATDAKDGVVFVVTYIKDAGYYAIVDGKTVKIQDFGTNGEGVYSKGSGFFVGVSGEDPMYIVTNQHVVQSYVDAGEGGRYVVDLGMTQDGYPYGIIAGSCELRVYYDENDYDVAYIDSQGDEEKVDLAVLKLRNATDKRRALQIQLPTMDMVGERVYTIGFPGIGDNSFTSASKYGLNDMSVKGGIISGIRAAEGTGVERIHTDAEIQPGNSGGPLVSEDGYVIGVNTNSVIGTSSSQQLTNYYAVSASELVDFLNKNNIPYEMAGQGGISLSMLVIVVCAAVCAGAAAAVVFVVLPKRKKAVSGGKTESAAKAAGTSSSAKSAKRAFIRSMAVQHNGLTLVVGEAPILVGRDSANCKLVYVDGTVGVSGRHCSVSYDAATGEFIVTDLRSTYGTFLMGGQKLNANVPYRLKPGESFYVGDKANVIRVELG